MTRYIENYGLNNFFRDYNKMVLPYEAYEKLENLGLILETLNEQEVNF